MGGRSITRPSMILSSTHFFCHNFSNEDLEANEIRRPWPISISKRLTNDLRGR